MFEQCTNTKKQGDAGLGACIAYFTSFGLTVALPITDSQDYDLVVDIDGLKKVQVKTTTYKPKKGDIYEVDLRIKGGNTKSNFVNKKGTDIIYDYLFVQTGSNEKFLIPKEAFKNNSSSVKLGDKYKEYKV